jgi:hypothetical protein
MNAQFGLSISVSKEMKYAGSSEHDNELSGTVQGGKFLN